MLDPTLLPDVEQFVLRRDLRGLRRRLDGEDPADLAALLTLLPEHDVPPVFRVLPHGVATEAFAFLPSEQQEALVDALAASPERLADLLNDLSPDDRTALLEELPGPVAQRLLALLAPKERALALRLLGYPEDSVGRLMTTDYVAIRPDWSVDDALRQVRRYGRDAETIDVVYVVERGWKLVDDVRLRELLLAAPGTPVQALLDRRFHALDANAPQEAAVEAFRAYGRAALPVTDRAGTLLGIVTHDDVLGVAEEEATEDIQRIGGLEALDEPYVDTPFWTLIRKRARWLVVLFVGELLTATAMGFFEHEIARAVVLALFVPLIISSGGNSGSQAASLMIRALALGEVKLRDALWVLRREAISGLVLGVILGTVGFLRILVWQHFFHAYGPHGLLVALTVGLSLVGVVLWGTLSGAMLPFLMQRLGADPAASSAPFVATLVDVTGLVIYFTVAALLLSGTLL